MGTDAFKTSIKYKKEGYEMKKQIVAILMALLVISLANTAYAGLITENFSGTITYADASNPFDVAADDLFGWTTTYDLTYQNSLGNIVIGDDQDMKLSVTIGSRTFGETEDVFYGPGTFGAPILTFDDQDRIDGVSLLVDDYANGYRFRSLGDGSGFGIYSIGADGFSDGIHLVSGTFSFDAAPVPIPGALWLMGSGLVGLLGYRRRKV
jgi:hypothetical protein